jgi:hypothetical protein
MVSCFRDPFYGFGDRAATFFCTHFLKLFTLRPSSRECLNNRWRKGALTYVKSTRWSLHLYGGGTDGFGTILGGAGGAEGGIGPGFRGGIGEGGKGSGNGGGTGEGGKGSGCGGGIGEGGKGSGVGRGGTGSGRGDGSGSRSSTGKGDTCGRKTWEIRSVVTTIAQSL